MTSTHPVKKGPIDNSTPTDLVLLALQIVYYGFLRIYNRYNRKNLLVRGVASEIRRDETLHARCDGCIDEFVLVAQSRAGNEGEDGILAFECFCERIGAVEVGTDDFDRVWKCGFGGLPGEDRDVEVGVVEESAEDGGTEVASGLKSLSVSSRCD